MNGNCICDRLTDGQTDRQTDGLRNGEEIKSPLRLASWGLKNSTGHCIAYLEQVTLVIVSPI
jgi:hypothetical protein